MKIYVASSWRNKYYSDVVQTLRSSGFEVYDFRNPPKGACFKWSYISENYMEWTPNEFKRELMSNPLASQQLKSDIEAMQSCDVCVLVLPCGRSAHTEAGWFVGKGKCVLVYIPERVEPELMYGLFSNICCSIDELVETLKKLNG